MNFPPTDGQGTLLARIEKLEKENAWLKRSGAIALLIVSALLLMGQAKQGATPWQKQVFRVGTLQANTIELLPESALGAKGFSPVPALRISPYELIMFDQNGKARVSLNGSMGELQMGELEIDNTGHVPVLSSGSTVRLDGLGSGGGLTLNDKSGKQTISLGTQPDDAGSGSPGKAFLNLISDAPRLFLGRNDSDSTVIGSEELVTSSTGKSRRTSAASVVLTDPKGNIIWSAEQADQAVNYLDGQSRFLQLSVDNSKRDMDDLKKEFNDFRDGACPVLRTASVGWEARMKLIDACGGH